ncbi:hypothetical protein [Chamaesiphon sp. VAR_48_metabat_135_sub]|uniref:hypothetical protein n=1 Tax=Chamaesiphon sp. VAR_48_metabat_135_sub TaxID=2964699 RepID=UPI00286A2E07|nr:hypothetical protein [Chamaesiphon sp. VAR_48_metabat_135_sub]
MLSQLTIPKQNDRLLAFDRQQLYAIGLKHVQQLSSRIWTDYNVHDPGITTLELLAYALTDLSYRASFPVADLLASNPNQLEVEVKNCLFTARQILPSRSLTLLDYRKLLIDIKNVKNAWLYPASTIYYADKVKGKLLREKPPQPGIVDVNLAGLYEVKIEYVDEITDADKQTVMQLVQQKLQTNRNLCEDFIKFTEVETQLFQLCAELELAPDADVTKVNAEILTLVAEYLSPSIEFHTLTEMLARKHPDGTLYSVDEIFDGPALDRGFIDDRELAQADLRTEIRLSDIISIIMDIPGVQAVRDIVINPQGGSAVVNKWVIPVEVGKKAKLMNQEPKGSRLVFYKRNMPVVPSLKAESLISKPDRTNVVNDLETPVGTYRDLASYYSFQNHFPAIYGLSEVGLSSGSDDERKALAYQLKAYLLFFDQIMANYLAQLSHVKELFSIDPNLSHTYSSQLVNSFVDYHQIYTDNIESFHNQNSDREQATGFDRRNRFLDHLISRFAEQFHDFADTMYSIFHESPKSIIRSKCEFLASYPSVSQERSLAYNYSLTADRDLWNTDNISGLERRLAKLLDIRNHQRRNLGEITDDADTEVTETAANEFQFRIRKRDSQKTILSSNIRYATSELAKIAMVQAIDAALLDSGYQRKVATNNKYYFNIINNTGQILARRIEYFDTEIEMNSEIDRIMEYLRMNYSNEGMYLIENILLRPEPNIDLFLPICPAPNCTDCGELDPYSYRLNIILPADSSRFRNMNFRRFAEQVIREETPAHILPKICWASKQDTIAIEQLYRDWIYLKAGVDTTESQAKLSKFITQLFAVKNIYPSQKLSECDAPENQPKFILGQNTLATRENINL